MARYGALEESGYTDVFRSDTLMSLEHAARATRHKQPLKTSAVFYAKKDGVCFRVDVHRIWRNRSANDPEREFIGAVTEVTADEYRDARAKIGLLHRHPSF
jgi:hypothetical protein